MNPIWLVRMARWVRNPPKPWQLYTILGVIGLFALLIGWELAFGWPEALKVNAPVRRPLLNAP